MRALTISAILCLMVSMSGCTQNDSPAAGMTGAGQSSSKKSVIILCTGNSCRSQMAEAFWKRYGGDRWDVVSAGTKPSGRVHPLAIEAMREKDIDISGYHSKDSTPFTNRHFDLVVTVCDNAERECPAFSNADKHLHWPFDDPPKAPGDDAAKMIVCRRVRDEIETAIRDYLNRNPSASAVE